MASFSLDDILGGTFSPQDEITRAKIDLQDTHPFFAYIIMNMKMKPMEEGCPTMGVSRFGNLYWNPGFVSTLERQHLHAIMAHEVLHVSTLTFQRKGNRDHDLWNIATDYVINYIAKKEGFVFPPTIRYYGTEKPIPLCMPADNGDISVTDAKGVKHTFNVDGKVAEEVYEFLYSHATIIKRMIAKPGSKSGDPGDARGKYAQLDDHLDTDDDNPNPTGAQEAENEQYWRAKMVEAGNHAKARGKISSQLQREIGDILAPRIDWRTRLYQFITKDLPVDFTMRRPGRRSEALGMYMPMVVRENMEVIVAPDVSGSITPEEYRDFMSEVIGIANGFDQIKMRCLPWATTILEEDDIEVTRDNHEILLQHEVVNSGGTTMSCIGEYMTEKGYHPPVVVILTDGHIEQEPVLPDTNVLFVLSEGGKPDIIEKYGPITCLSDVSR